MMVHRTSQEQTDADSDCGRVPLVADTPLSDPALDAFGFVVFANALCLVVDHKRTVTPLTIAVSAPWGGGKSSVGGMMETLLERRVVHRHGDDPRVVCWFNAWEHEDASHLGAALAGAVAREASRHRSWWRRVLLPLPSAMLDSSERLRRTWLMVVSSLVIAGLLALVTPTRGLVKDVVGQGALPGGIGGAIAVSFVTMLLFQRVFATARSAAQFIDDPRSAATRGTMADVKRQLGTLIRHATGDGRLVILVDDLDRCESARALEVCRVASQLLAHEGVVTILLADMTRISESAAIRYASAAESLDSAQTAIDTAEVGRRYLEKIAQIEVALPLPDPAAMRQVSSDYTNSLRAPPSSAASAKQFLLRRVRLHRVGARPAAEAIRRRVDAFLDHRADAFVDASDRTTQRSQDPFVRVVEGGPLWVEPFLSWVARSGWPLAAVLFCLGFVPSVFSDAATQRGAQVDSWVILSAVMWLVALGFGISSSALRLRQHQNRRRRAAYARRIQELKDGGDLSEEAIASELISEQSSSPTPHEQALIGDLVSSSFLDSPEFRAVERFIAEYPQPLPRESKRMFNHAQLLTQIARAREMFGGDPPLESIHLAKWIVLRERWPTIGRAVLENPALLSSLEAAAVGDLLETELDTRVLGTSNITGLAEFLQRPPLLGPLIERLVNFKPADASCAPRGRAPMASTGLPGGNPAGAETTSS